MDFAGFVAVGQALSAVERSLWAEEGCIGMRNQLVAKSIGLTAGYWKLAAVAAVWWERSKVRRNLVRSFEVELKAGRLVPRKILCPPCLTPRSRLSLEEMGAVACR